MQCFPRKITCKEKARLLRRHATAESDYYRAIQVLSAAPVAKETQWQRTRGQRKKDGRCVGRAGAPH